MFSQHFYNFVFIVKFYGELNHAKTSQGTKSTIILIRTWANLEDSLLNKTKEVKCVKSEEGI